MHILAVFVAKFAAIRPFRALFTAQGLPSDGVRRAAGENPPGFHPFFIYPRIQFLLKANGGQTEHPLATAVHAISMDMATLRARNAAARRCSVVH
ncbi:MAG: hypothetical protein LBL31_08870, partial [Spirochaetaceae bacterium]|nr:hypothetical protein [Spirochaetaceae bacterium]